jgi:hypothetical protein
MNFRRDTLVRLLLTPSLITMRDVARELYDGLAFARDRASDSASALAQALDFALDSASNLASALARARDRALNLAGTRARDLAGTLDITLDFARNFARALANIQHASNRIAIGTALTRALVNTPYRRSPYAPGQHRFDSAFPSWIERFARMFTTQTGIAGATFVVPLDNLEKILRAGRERLPTSPDAARNKWASTVAGRLEEIALPVVTRREPIMADTASAIRIAALCLAVEADKGGSILAGDAYRQIAAGITLMERRANGDAPVTETIMLATS